MEDETNGMFGMGGNRRFYEEEAPKPNKDG
jgi:hypothetical protein